MKILLIDNYDSFTYNLFHYISNFKKNVDVVRNDKIDGKTILRKGYNKVVISPGPGNPNQGSSCNNLLHMLSELKLNFDFFCSALHSYNKHHSHCTLIDSLVAI